MGALESRLSTGDVTFQVRRQPGVTTKLRLAVGDSGSLNAARGKVFLMLHLCNYKWSKSICKGGVFYLAIEVASALSLSLSPLPHLPPPPSVCETG